MSSLLLVILVGAVLVNTFLLMHDDEALGGDRKSGSTARAIRIAAGSWVTLVLSIMLTKLIAALLPNYPDVLLLVYSAAVAAIAIVLHRFTRRRLPKLRRSLASSPLLIVGNSLALGTMLLQPLARAGFFAVSLYALALGAGFVSLLALFVSLIARITEREVPAAFRLAPITLISAGITTLALMGFTGLLRV
ncbi:MAG TPA: Rnf-Nqr domain containing protein [Steroidobacteraceae bacterium]|nr:Rnf-Nqr domain containing protein [Steroidobacteraceae bacterium]